MQSTIEIISKKEQIIFVVRWIRDICTALHLSDKKRFAFELSVEELITNVVSYAYEELEDHCPIKATFSLDGNRATVWIEDHGIPFNPVELTTPPMANSIEEAKIGGLGIVLVKQLMDGMAYDRKGDKNILSIWMDLQSEGADASLDQH